MLCHKRDGAFLEPWIIQSCSNSSPNPVPDTSLPSTTSPIPLPSTGPTLEIIKKTKKNGKSFWISTESVFLFKIQIDKIDSGNNDDVTSWSYALLFPLPVNFEKMSFNLETACILKLVGHSRVFSSQVSPFSDSLKAIKVTCCQWRSRFLKIFKHRRYFTLILFFLRPHTEIGSFWGSDATSLWMYVTRTSVKFSQAQTLVYVGMLLYNLAEGSSKWPCRDSVLQVAKPIFPHSRYF